mmetsp:Transcript_8028/g.10208  ORF Transcript_8028/g.10208 Transcript_8028/m.10208 type:complete len:81 (+) Transcript_8028:197-439(+)
MYDFLTDYPHATEELDKGYLQSYWRPITTAIFCDADHAHHRRPYQSYCCFCWQHPGPLEKCQIDRSSSTYSAEFMLGLFS